MITLFIYLTTLIIAPQLWIEPFMDMRVDLFVYPLWLILAFVSTRTQPFTLTTQDKFFLLMVFWIIISILVNGLRDWSTDVVIKYVKWFVLYKLVSHTVSDMDRLGTVGKMLLFFTLLLAVEGIDHIQHPEGIGWAGQPLGWIDPGAREAGELGRTQWINIFDGPGTFCVIYTIGLPFLLQYLASPFPGWVRLLALPLTILLLVATYYTGTRGGFLATLGVISLFIAIRSGVSLSRIVLIGGIVAAAFALAPAHLTTFDDPSKSAAHRVDMWAEGVEMVQQNPVFGIGKGNFLSYTNRLLGHNSAVEIMGETGIIGLFWWIGLIYMGLKNVTRYVEEAENTRYKAYALATGLSVAGYVISAMFITLEYETLYFLLGLCNAVGLRLKTPYTFTEKDFWRISFLTIGWVVGMRIFIMYYYLVN